MLYFPSEKAPAPPKPLMMLQTGQRMQDFTFFPSMGHLRWFSGRPSSKTATFSLLFINS